ncbi:MAG: hypothetical protein JST01_08700 [Cyanobacteria bacterium SZAS TMP-1]|nr:hypothetical protein [Cyanobacteria bacterium SZAS TMP-1]
METMQIVEVAVIAGAALALSFVCINNRRGGGDYLCSDCRFNADKDCLKVGRPQVMVCTSYRQGSAGTPESDINK